jgi:hypothetical protein
MQVLLMQVLLMQVLPSQTPPQYRTRWPRENRRKTTSPIASAAIPVGERHAHEVAIRHPQISTSCTQRWKDP